MTTDLSALLFRPSSILVYGASSDPDKLSGRPVDYLRRFGYPGAVYPVNKHRRVVQGMPAYAVIEDIGEPVDLAVVVVPAGAVLDALTRCARHGVRAAIIFASGYAEAAISEGAALQEQISRLARESGMRIVGPNCLGTFSVLDQMYATFSTAFDDRSVSAGGRVRADSPVAIVSQSGAVGTFAYSALNALGVGVRFFANTGNQADVTAVEVLRALAEEPRVTTLVGHLEDGRDIAGLQDLAAVAARNRKDLVLLKGGRTPAGARAVEAHTASVAGDSALVDETVSAHGAIVVPGLEELVDTVLCLQQQRVPAGPRLTLLTLSGGCAAIATDAAVEAGLTVDTWSVAADRVAIAERLPYFASTRNPIDLTGAMLTDLGSLVHTLDLVGRNAETDSICLVLGNADRNADEIVDALTVGCRATAKPFVVSWTGGTGRPVRELLGRGVPTYTDPGRAVRVLARVTLAAERRRAGLSCP